jgi:hypothetical protein
MLGAYVENTMSVSRHLREKYKKCDRPALPFRREVQSQRLKKPGDDVNLSSHTKYERRK